MRAKNGFMKILTAVILLLIPSLILAQHEKLNQRYPGYFINAKGDTIRGYILLINKLDNQAGSEYSNDSRGEKIKIFLMPDQVRGFKMRDRNYTSIEYGDPDPKSEHFLLTLAEGDLKLYQFFRLPENLYVPAGSGQRPATGNDEQYLQSEFIIVNDSGKQFTIGGESALLKNSNEIFKGNDSLLNRIRNKEKGYRYIDLLQLIKQYNDSM